MTVLLVPNIRLKEFEIIADYQSVLERISIYWQLQVTTLIHMFSILVYQICAMQFFAVDIKAWISLFQFAVLCSK